MKRRNFIQSSLALSTLTAAQIAQSKTTENQTQPSAVAELTVHTLPTLPYSYNALEPFIDAQTMELHYSKHHKGYVDGLNKAEAELEKARQTNDFSMIEYWSKKAAFHGGGHTLHSLFWKTMAPVHNGGGSQPSGQLATLINRDFNSFTQFKAHFSAAAASVEGSGWAILHQRLSDGRLLILQAENQHKLTPWGTVPILALDVWEHAYYLKYQNKRSEYISAWWNLVHWSMVESLLMK